MSSQKSIREMKNREREENNRKAKILAEQEIYMVQLKKAETELTNLKHDIESYVVKFKNREIELRNHIANLSTKLRNRDVDTLKNNMCELKQQIITTLNEIQEKSRAELIDKKKELQLRTKLRLSDSEYRHNYKLSEKAKEQVDVLNSLSEHTLELQRIRDNYEVVKQKVDDFTKSNTNYRFQIQDLEMKISKTKIDITNFKKFSIHLRSKIDGRKFVNRKSSSIIKNQIINSPSVKDQACKSSEEISMNTFNMENSNDSSNCNIDYRTNRGASQFKYELELNSVIKKLNDQEFLNKNPRAAGVMSSLANKYENSKIRYNKLKKEVSENQLNSDLHLKVYDIIKNMKIDDLNTSNPLIKSKSQGSTIKYDVYMNKEQRLNFTNYLVNDPVIFDIMKNNKLQNFAMVERKINI
jgi:hypothetical protein